ncbi:MAG: hypothetical protein ACLSCV_10690 [Acutalibacteraceae bacterium]
MEFEPSDSEGLEFEERVVGGAVPKGFSRSRKRLA